MRERLSITGRLKAIYQSSEWLTLSEKGSRKKAVIRDICCFDNYFLLSIFSKLWLFFSISIV
jgi:hypothetical protein